MNSEMTFLLLNIVISFFGVYLIGVALKMKKEQKLNSTVIAKEEISKCRDVKGYIDFVVPKMVIFGFVIIVAGILGILEDYFVFFYRFRFITLIFFLITFMVYIYEMKVARNKFMY